jgi:hypothetical protein
VPLIRRPMWRSFGNDDPPATESEDMECSSV